jgi:hypothetical protein
MKVISETHRLHQIRYLLFSTIERSCVEIEGKFIVYYLRWNAPSIRVIKANLVITNNSEWAIMLQQKLSQYYLTFR